MLVDKYAMNFGLVFGLYWVVVFFMRILVAYNSVFSIAYLVLLLGTLYWCVRFGKAYLVAMNEAGRRVMALQFIGFGVMLFFYAGLIDALVQFLYYRFLNPNYITQQIEASMAMLNEIESAARLRELYGKFGAPSPIQMAMQIVWNSVLSGGILFALLAPFLLSKQQVAKTS